MKVLIEVEYRNHTEIELTNEKGDTYRSKSEELQDFFSGLQEFKFDVIHSCQKLNDKETQTFEDWLKDTYIKISVNTYQHRVYHFKKSKHETWKIYNILYKNV